MCDGSGFDTESNPQHPPLCGECGGLGILDLDPFGPCEHLPGSAERVAKYATRYRAQLPLWNPDDAKDGGRT